MDNIETKELKTAFYATFSQGFFATLTFSMFMVNSPILFDLIDMTKTEFSMGFICQSNTSLIIPESYSENSANYTKRMLTSGRFTSLEGVCLGGGGLVVKTKTNY